ncbi:hypothetical protein PVAND_009466 [Polypedilum vanderplanki]|uniref:DUF4729 domain-containing protein n=1 Tax=Polypedilum vanderplanki TaxID=319348 RepID=A0A9J6CCZ9_POLVA|nr:hypothetical protein PVAND_009466 [Polypedilum vanderplanki]
MDPDQDRVEEIEESLSFTKNNLPFNCILSNCNEPLTNSSVISHLTSTNHNIESQDVEFNEKVSLMVSVDENFMSYGKNVCLGVLGLKIKKHDETTNSIKENILAISIMACKSNYYHIYDNNKNEKADPDGDFLTFWLVMAKPDDIELRAAVSANNESDRSSLSTLINVRDIRDCQNVAEFMSNDIDFLKINRSMWEKIINDDALLIEVMMMEK